MSREHFLKKNCFGVLGLGRSGIAVSHLLSGRGKQIHAVDSREHIDADLNEEGITLHLGTNLFPDNIELIVASPGASPSSEVFQKVNIDIVSEVEIGWEASDAKVVAITGTDGKTTTTELLNFLLCSAGRQSCACGNIGTTISEVVCDENNYENLVLEISAFQLWSTHYLKPEVVVFTNIAEDHIDYFDHFEEYVAAKKRLMKNASEEDVGVFNTSDTYIEEWGKHFPGQVYTYGLNEPAYGKLRMWLEAGAIYFKEEGKTSLFLKMDEVLLIGDHNALNIMAAALGAKGLGVDFSMSSQFTKKFSAPRHRLQKLGRFKNITFYNDSKATNAHAAMAGIRNLPEGLTVIAGGLDKGLDLKAFSEMLLSRADHVIIIGEIQERLKEALKEVRHPSVHLSDTMVDAVNKAISLTPTDGVISLSPACSSFDMYKSYAERGEIFINVVESLK